MRQKKIHSAAILFAIISLFLIGCEKENDVIYDKLVRIEIPNGAYGTFSTQSTDWQGQLDPAYSLPDFNKDDYPDVDSIVFVTTMKSDYIGNIYNSAKCYVELFNITDTVSIENSLIESKSAVFNYFYSKNIYNALPSKKVELGLRIKSEIEGIRVYAGTSYLYIYRH